MVLENPKKTESGPEQPQIPKNPNEVLGIKPGASPEEINRAWRKKVREFHPDKNPSLKNQEWIRAINSARDNLLKNMRGIKAETPRNEVKIKQWQQYVARRQEEQRKKEEETRREAKLEEIRKELRGQERILELRYRLGQELRHVNAMLDNYRFYNPVAYWDGELKNELKKLFINKKKVAEVQEQSEKEKRMLEGYQTKKVELENRLSQMGR